MKDGENEDKSPVVEELATVCRQYPSLDPRDPLDAIADPQWDDASRTDDWRNYVDSEVAAMWDRLSAESRLVAYLTAAGRAETDAFRY